MTRGRPAIEPGEWGEISAWQETTKAGRTYWRASVIAVTPLGERRKRRATRDTRGAAIKAVQAMARETVGDTTTSGAAVKPSTPIGELVPAYLDHRKGDLSPRSERIYKSVFDGHVLPTIGQLQIRQATTAAMDTFLHRLTPGTAKTAQALLSGAFSQAQRWGVVATNPMRGTTRPTAKPQRPEALDAAQLSEWRARVRAYQTADDIPGPATRADPLLRIVDVLAGTGARPSELLAARWEDVSLEAPATLRLRGTKTENAPRVVRLPTFAVEALEEQRRALGAAADLYPHVWPTASGTPISLSSLERWFRGVRDHWANTHRGEVDLLPKVTPKRLRKTVATIIADEVGEYEASRQLGHGDTAVTRRHYLQEPPLGPDVAGVLQDHLRPK